MQKIHKEDSLYTFQKSKGCLKCLALLDDNYAAIHDNPCLHCLEQLRSSKEAVLALRRLSVWSWLKKDMHICQKIKPKTKAP